MGPSASVRVPLHVDRLRFWLVLDMATTVPTHLLSMSMHVLGRPRGLAAVEYRSCKLVQWPWMVRLLGLALRRAAWHRVSMVCVGHVCGEACCGGDPGEATTDGGGQALIRI